MIAIAIDGPSGAGKSTLSRRLAGALGYIYVDTGALYRAVGLAALRGGLDTKNGESLAGLLPALQVGLRHVDGEQRVFLGNEDVSAVIRDEKVGMAASEVSAHAPVRAFLLDTQRRLAAESNVVMDGRDIGTVVLPNAQVKVFLTADAEDRARRRALELEQKGLAANYETVLADVKRRDHSDTSRAVSPLRRAADAVLLDTTGNTFEQSLALLLDTVQKRLAALGEAAG